MWGSVGRVMYHHMDLENLRVPKFEMNRYFCHLEMSQWGHSTKQFSEQVGVKCSNPTGGHWEAEGGEAALAELLERSLKHPAPKSRCHSALRFCLCRDDWDRYPQLSQDVVKDSIRPSQGEKKLELRKPSLHRG